MTISERKVPHGEDEIVEFYGWNPEKYLSSDGSVKFTWEGSMMVRVPLPEPLMWLGKPIVKSVCVHRKLADIFDMVYRDVHREGLWRLLSPYGGGYVFRLIRGGSSLSMHGFGAAVDHDPVGNPLGADPLRTKFGGTGDGREVVRIFKSYGFTWGGDFKGRKDAMHFQYGTGY